MRSEEGHFWGGILIASVLSTLAWCDYQERGQQGEFTPPQRKMLEKRIKSDVAMKNLIPDDDVVIFLEELLELHERPKWWICPTCQAEHEPVKLKCDECGWTLKFD